MSEVVHAAGFFLSMLDNGQRRWLLLQNAKRGDWGFPKGHRDPGETDLQCAVRECAEEAGIALLEVTADPVRIQYTLNKGRTKEVTYFPAETQQQDVKLSKEHSQAQWLDAAGVIEHLPYPSIKGLFQAFLQREGLA